MLHIVSYIFHLTHFTLHVASYTLPLPHYILHFSSHKLFLIHCIFYIVSYTLHKSLKPLFKKSRKLIFDRTLKFNLGYFPNKISKYIKAKWYKKSLILQKSHFSVLEHLGQPSFNELEEWRLPQYPTLLARYGPLQFPNGDGGILAHCILRFEPVASCMCYTLHVQMIYMLNIAFYKELHVM